MVHVGGGTVQQEVDDSKAPNCCLHKQARFEQEAHLDLRIEALDPMDCTLTDRTLIEGAYSILRSVCSKGSVGQPLHHQKLKQHFPKLHRSVYAGCSGAALLDLESTCTA